MNTIQEIPPNELSIFKGNVKEWLDNDQQITQLETHISIILTGQPAIHLD